MTARRTVFSDIEKLQIQEDAMAARLQLAHEIDSRGGE
jgi:hypothetical protein